MIYQIRDQETSKKKTHDKVILESSQWLEVKIALKNLNKDRIGKYAYVAFMSPEVRRAMRIAL